MRKIYCANCTRYLGEIRNATLRKGVSYLCSKCESARRLLSRRINDTPDIFNDLFGGKL